MYTPEEEGAASGTNLRYRSPGPEKKRPHASEQTGDKQTTIRKTTASGGGASDMNTNSHGSPEEERRGGERREDRVSELWQ